MSLVDIFQTEQASTNPIDILPENLGWLNYVSEILGDDYDIGFFDTDEDVYDDNTELLSFECYLCL